MLIHPRDPAFVSRLGLAALALALLVPLVRLSGLDPTLLANPDTLSTLGGFIAGFFPPAHDDVFLNELAAATAQTLAVATTGTALAVLIGWPAALAVTRALALDSLTASRPAGWQRLGAPLLRGMLLVLRGVPEVVWALLFVRAVGLGPCAAVLAIGLAYGGMLGKVYAEILESQPKAPARALRAAGSGRLATLAYGLLPQALPELVSYTVYRWECAIRASAVMGFVGAGGVGQLLDQSIKMMAGNEVSSLLLVFVLLVVCTEGVSRLARVILPSAHGKSALGFTALLALAASSWLLIPQIDWDGLSFGALGGYAREFFPMDVSGEHLARVGSGTLETLAVSAIGTLLAFGGGALLALPAAGRHGAIWQQASRFALNLLRGVPDLLWAALAVLAVGLGPFAGVLALSLHTAGVLGRLFAETLENAPPAAESALLRAGSPRGLAFLYGTLPLIWKQWIAYALYRWENNIRIAAVLGIVGAGGLGQLLYTSLSLFQQPQAASVLLAMLLLSAVVERLSLWLRGRMPG